MKAYLKLLQQVFDHGELRENRTDTPAKSLFGAQLRFDISTHFPLLTTKKISFPLVVHELLWFLKGETNIDYLRQNKVTIWNEWADDKGELGPIYGHQWRSWSNGHQNPPIDQISRLIDNLKTDPFSRRHLVSAWNVNDLDKMALAPCHVLFQFYVSNDRQLSCQLYQRSADLFLGLPFNIACYALLTYLVAQVTALKPKEFVWTGGDIHLYTNHLEQAQLQLSRKPLPLCQLQLNPNIDNIFDFKAEDIQLINYQSHSTIKAPVAI